MMPRLYEAGDAGAAFTLLLFSDYAVLIVVDLYDDATPDYAAYAMPMLFAFSITPCC